MRRIAGFIGGGVVGVLIAAIVVVGIPLVSPLAERLGGRMAPMTIRGADLSQIGAAEVMFEGRGSVVTEHCHEACDDLVLPGSPDGVRVLDAQGHCIICRRFSLLSAERADKALRRAAQDVKLGAAHP